MSDKPTAPEVGPATAAAAAENAQKTTTGKKRVERKLGAAVNRPAWDPDFQPLADYLLKSGGVPIRGAVEVGRKTVNYCRGKDLVKWVLKNEETLRKMFPQCFDTPDQPLTVADTVILGTELTKRGFFYKAQHQPIGQVNAKGAATSNSPNGSAGTGGESDVPKWPKKLSMTPTQNFDPNYFYVLQYQPPSSWPHILLALMIGLVLVVCLFPAWPVMLKLAVWYVLFCFASFFLVAVVVRLILFLLVWFFGVDFWLFPNLFDEDLGVIESFMPFYSFEYRRDPWLMVAGRVFLALLLAGTLYQLNQTHSISDVHRFAKQQFFDVLDWGHQKLTAPYEDDAGGHAKRLADAGSEMDDEEALDPVTRKNRQFSCMAPCGFNSYQELEDECLTDCRCMKEVLDSHCYLKCPQATKEKLTKVKEETCDVLPGTRVEQQDDTEDDDDAEPLLDLDNDLDSADIDDDGSLSNEALEDGRPEGGMEEVASVDDASNEEL